MYLGATIRWLFRPVWRMFFNTPKVSFLDYLNDNRESKDHKKYESYEFINQIVAIFFIIGLLYVFIDFP